MGCLALGARKASVGRWGDCLGPWARRRQKFTNKVCSRFQDAMCQMLLLGLMSCPGSGEANSRESLGEKRVERVLRL